ncbi:2-keto-3-deoxygluconate kinase (plasmid) [Deinococcus geothermalis DSM 11300]|uniref:2-keto-3-deoxygluconate kinase n=1 Tax=Deinococcus geothermalis (strain DSM 11300 / CIP 105573 / AG-3a) TaxID=319795 RepID=Q1J2P0_DEIGD|nr:sugar kinase [Deinococcus geothermalis]ABF44244.1 2-keto-3-deoxygluconate kinase [Deinococcus geothermalis DSM 11300]
MAEAPTSVLTFGEALLKLVLLPTQRLESMQTLDAQCAGAELNVAAALAALGRPAAWVSALPAGPLGTWVRERVRALKVDDLALTREGRLGTFYLEDHHPPRPSRVVYDRRGSAFTQLNAADFDPAWLAGRRALHVSGISLAVGQGPRDLALKLMWEARQAGVVISFDVNHRRLLLAEDAARELYTPALRLADLIFVAERDTPLLGGLTGLRSLASRAWIVQTRGMRGSAALTPDGQTYQQPIIAASGPGRVGRGDAFAGGFLHAFLQGKAPPAALAFATAAAALKTTTPGDQLQATEAEVWAVLQDGQASEPIR